MIMNLSFCIFLLVVIDMVDDVGRMRYGGREALRSLVRIECAFK